MQPRRHGCETRHRTRWGRGPTQRRGSRAKRPTGLTTLAIDIGGTGLKASVLDTDGGKIVDRVRTKTPYPCPPRVLIRELDKLTHQLPPWDRISVGFPGFVRAGRVLTAPNLSTKAGPGTAMSRKLVEAWAGFPLAAELEGRLGKPTRLSNDADMHGLAVIRGEGLELVLTLGTGLGTAVFLDGTPTPHLELALMPFQGRGTFQDQLGNRRAAASGTVAGANGSSPPSRCSTRSCTSTGSMSAAATRRSSPSISGIASNSSTTPLASSAGSSYGSSTKPCDPCRPRRASPEGREPDDPAIAPITAWNRRRAGRNAYVTIVGIHASHEQMPPSELLYAVRFAESAGFDAAMCSDHLAPWGERQGHSGHAWTWLGAALQATEIAFGVVTAPGQRYHPVVLAQAIATLGELFPDRFWAALGTGEAINEHVTGDRWPDKPTRDARLLECVDVMRALLRGEEVTHHGLVERRSGAPLEPARGRARSCSAPP